MTEQKIPYQDLISMELFEGREPIQIDLAYADAHHPDNVFDTDIYHSQARLWTHRDVAAVTLLAARRLNREHHWILQLKDCLRTVEAQEVMAQTELVKAHPEWQKAGPSQMLAPPGKGAHPRAMAMDVCVLGEDGEQLDMGTRFDAFPEDLNDNPAARDYTGHSPEILGRRKILEEAFLWAAESLNLPFIPYPAEWWDFRFTAEYYNQFAPLSDRDLPPQMRMSSLDGPDIPDLPDAHFESLALDILALVNRHDGSF
ncbi:MAG: D-Ala-D-Ala dipeptidase [Alphaproteobacteria bacterium]|nr:D-Ala-D-Ala dipeptidase [Alphaproteobacteria bacterium]